MKKEKITISQITSIIETNRKEVFKSINRIMLETYYEIGKILKEKEDLLIDEYGNSYIDELSKELTIKYGRSYSRSNLFNMKKLYLSGYSVQTSGLMDWSHLLLLININDIKEREFYFNECNENKRTTKELQREIKTCLYQRTLLGQKTSKLSKNSECGFYLKDPLVLDFLNINESTNKLEKDLESAILNHLSKFLLELGKGFTFIGTQEHFTINGKDYYVDLVLYNFILKCYVLIDLKIKEFEPENVGQMNFYLSYYEKERRVKGDNPPIGIILCAKKDNVIVNYSLNNINNKIYAGVFTNVMPKKEILEEQIAYIIDYKFNELNNSERLIYEIIKNNNNISIKELIIDTSLKRSTINKYIKSLKEKGFIRRIGNETSGNYEILIEIINK